MTAKSPTKSDQPVAAREQLEQLTDPKDTVSTLEERVEEQEKRQAEELKAGQNGTAKDGPTLAHNRAPESGPNSGVQGGHVDQWTRRDMSDALEGHFVTVDRNHKDVDLPDGHDGYGVFVEVATVGEDTYPETARVRFRGETITHVFPYEALQPAEARGR